MFPALVGIGALATAFTVTVFYMLTVDIWRVRFNRSLGWLVSVGGGYRAHLTVAYFMQLRGDPCVAWITP
jgi:hypothetical protein